MRLRIESPLMRGQQRDKPNPMKANSSNYGSTVPEITAALLADEPAQSTLGRFQTTCEFCGRFMFERDERRDYAVCPTCERDRARSRAGCMWSDYEPRGENRNGDNDL